MSLKQKKDVQRLLEQWDESTSPLSVQLQNAIFRGFPHEFRPGLWKQLLESDTLRAWTDFDYKEEVGRVREQLVDLGISEYMAGNDAVSHLTEIETSPSFSIKFGDISLDTLRHIFLDLERTYPEHSLYGTGGTDPAMGRRGRAALFRVLAAYARFNRGVGYCQGMTASAALLLAIMLGEDRDWNGTRNGDRDMDTWDRNGDGNGDRDKCGEAGIMLEEDRDMDTRDRNGDRDRNGVAIQDRGRNGHKDENGEKDENGKQEGGDCTDKDVHGDLDKNRPKNGEEDGNVDRAQNKNKNANEENKMKNEDARDKNERLPDMDEDWDKKEEEAFWAFLSLLERHKYLVGYFDTYMSRLHTHAAVFDKLVESRFPKLADHLRECGVESLMYLTPWFITVYTSWPCWDTVLAIWDLLLLHGHSALIRVALTALDLLQEELMECEDINTILPKLLHVSEALCQFDVFMPRLATVLVYDWEITSIMASMEEEKQRPRPKKRPRPAAKYQTRAAKRRKENSTLAAYTPERSGLLRKFTRLFNHSSPRSSPVLRSSSRKMRLMHGSGTSTPQKLTKGTGGAKRTPRGANQTPRGAKQTPRGANQTPRGANQTPRGANQTPRGAKRTPLRTLSIDRNHVLGKQEVMSPKRQFKSASQSGKGKENSNSNSSNKRRGLRIGQLQDVNYLQLSIDSNNNKDNNNKNNNKNDNNNNNPCQLSHPLEQLLLSSPHTTVSPALMKKFRTGPDSPLARHQRTARAQCLKSNGQRSTSRVATKLFSPSPQRIRRSSRRARGENSGSKLQPAGPGVGKRITEEDVGESEMDEGCPGESGQDLRSEISLEQSSRADGCLDGSEDAGPATQQAADEETDNEFDTTVDGLSLAAGDYHALQHFLAPLPLHSYRNPTCAPFSPREMHPLRTSVTSSSVDSKKNSVDSNLDSNTDSNLDSEFHSVRPKREMSAALQGGSMYCESPKSELIPFMDATKTLLTGWRVNRPI